MAATLSDILALDAFHVVVARELDPVDATRVLLVARQLARADVDAPLAAVARSVDPSPAALLDARGVASGKVRDLRLAARYLGVPEASYMPTEKLRPRVAVIVAPSPRLPLALLREVELEREAEVELSVNEEEDVENTLESMVNGSANKISRADALAGLKLTSAHLAGLACDLVRTRRGCRPSGESALYYDALDLVRVVRMVHGSVRALRRRLAEKSWRDYNARMSAKDPKVVAVDGAHTARMVRRYVDEILTEDFRDRRPADMDEVYALVDGGGVFVRREYVHARGVACDIVRERLLVEALREHGIELDRESVACRCYVHGTGVLADVVDAAVSARFFREETAFLELLPARFGPSHRYDAVGTYGSDVWDVAEARAEALARYVYEAGGVEEAKRDAPAPVRVEIDEFVGCAHKVRLAARKLACESPVTSKCSAGAVTAVMGGEPHRFAAELTVTVPREMWFSTSRVYVEVDSASRLARADAECVAVMRWMLDRERPIVRVPESAMGDLEFAKNVRSACEDAVRWIASDEREGRPLFLYPGSERKYERMLAALEGRWDEDGDEREPKRQRADAA